MAGDLDVLIDELYALPLERFVPERDVLAKQLRADGRREDAARVGRAGQAVDRRVGGQPGRACPARAAAKLWAAGDAVLDTQARVVAGDAAGPELRSAIETERRALRRSSTPPGA